MQNKFMYKALLTCLVASALSIPMPAQRGVAPNGYYPHTFSGDIYTGMLEVTAADPMHIALIYAKGDKSERFEGRLESKCTPRRQDNSAQGLNLAEFSKRVVLTAFYRRISVKSGGKKIHENLIIAISFAEVDGKKIPDDKRAIITCSDDQFVQFKAFSGDSN